MADTVSRKTTGPASCWLCRVGRYGLVLDVAFIAVLVFSLTRLAVNPEKIHHETIWGIADEDLYAEVLETFDVYQAQVEKSGRSTVVMSASTQVAESRLTPLTAVPVNSARPPNRCSLRPRGSHNSNTPRNTRCG